MKCARVDVSAELLAELLLLPQEVSVIGVSHDDNARTVGLLLQGPSFPEVQEGTQILPVMPDYQVERCGHVCHLGLHERTAMASIGLGGITRRRDHPKVTKDGEKP